MGRFARGVVGTAGAWCWCWFAVDRCTGADSADVGRGEAEVGTGEAGVGAGAVARAGTCGPTGPTGPTGRGAGVTGLPGAGEAAWAGADVDDGADAREIGAPIGDLRDVGFAGVTGASAVAR
ncbi:hypothetical protein ACFY8C_28105 [Streptomyces flavochromogenes]|uniref:Collagen-like protein n=1 Tax=Streptomyces flavochromogenes TaxID=68199 RepID=A0ABW6XXD9_9ACTN